MPTIDIENWNPKYVYTGNDVIAGQVGLELKRDTVFKRVYIVLKCKANTKVIRSTGQGSAVYVDHETFYKQELVFFEPTFASSAKHEPLAAGKHIFPFEFVLPSDPALPDSTHLGQGANIKWYLKLKVKRQGIFKRDKKKRYNIRVLQDRNFHPKDMDPPMQVVWEGALTYSARTGSFFSGDKCELDVRVLAYEGRMRQWPWACGLQVEIRSNKDSVEAAQLDIELRTKYRQTASVHTDRLETSRTKLIQDKTVFRLGLKFKAWEAVPNAKLGEIVAGHFSSKLIDVFHELKIKIRLQTAVSGKRARSKTFKLPIVLESAAGACASGFAPVPCDAVPFEDVPFKALEIE